MHNTFSFFICTKNGIRVTHGLQTPIEAFFHQNPKLLGLGRQFGQINFGAFGVFPHIVSSLQKYKSRSKNSVY